LPQEGGAEGGGSWTRKNWGKKVVGFQKIAIWVSLGGPSMDQADQGGRQKKPKEEGLSQKNGRVFIGKSVT